MIRILPLIALTGCFPEKECNTDLESPRLRTDALTYDWSGSFDDQGSAAISLLNYGPDAVTVSGLSVDEASGPWSMPDTTPLAVPGGCEDSPGTASIDTLFAPTVAGLFRATASILSDDPGATDHDPATGAAVWPVTLRGDAIAPCGRIAPQCVDFGARSAGGYFDATVTLWSCGSETWTVSSAGIRGDSGFTIGSQFPDYILGGATATLLIAWVPATGGPASAEVTLVTDDPRLDQTIQVFGNSGGGNCGTDGDGDGYSTLEGDCDDTNPTVYPMAGEAYDGVDNDCDGQIDEGTYSGDDDGDGYSEVRADGGPGDCDDTNPWIWSGAPEDCDGVDNDCDGVVDEGEDGVAGSTCDALTEGL